MEACQSRKTTAGSGKSCNLSISSLTSHARSSRMRTGQPSPLTAATCTRALRGAGTATKNLRR
eukprot:8149903-Lingulodinium_polyedra.AAC.1